MSTTRKGKTGTKYTRIGDRDGVEDFMVDPLDYLTLEQLPKEGSTIGGVIPIAVTAKQIVVQLHEAYPELKGSGLVDANLLGARMGTLHRGGVAVPVNVPRSGGLHGWQITKKGEEVLAAWREHNRKGDS